ncbi:MAG: citrate lyase acyl carrier protein [Clostridia bacterium]|nr:citrate lyase acyl carrier protein [Clostridia bacterium]
MKKIIRSATAGTLESSDALVTVAPHENGVVIEVDSVVQKQFGEEIFRAVEETLRALEVKDARVSVVDRGALDCVIRARVETAVLRGEEDA